MLNTTVKRRRNPRFSYSRTAGMLSPATPGSMGGKIRADIQYGQLENFCLDNGYSINEVIQEIGLSRSSSLNWRNGRCRPSVRTIVRIADFFNMTLSEFTRQITY